MRRGPHNGEVLLTVAEHEVLELRLKGMCRKEVASILHVSESAVKERLRGVMRAFGKSSLEGVLLMLGAFELQPMWTPNPKAPRIIIASKTQVQLKRRMRNGNFE